MDSELKGKFGELNKNCKVFVSVKAIVQGVGLANCFAGSACQCPVPSHRLLCSVDLIVYLFLLCYSILCFLKR
jgi:hypothetical protein